MDWMMMMTLLEMEIQHKPNGTDKHKMEEPEKTQKGLNLIQRHK